MKDDIHEGIDLENRVKELEELVDLKNRQIQVLIVSGKITNEDAKRARKLSEKDSL